MPETAFDFPNKGVGAFAVTGSERTDRFDPADTTAFITGLTFEGNRTFNGTQTPIAVAVAAAPNRVHSPYSPAVYWDDNCSGGDRSPSTIPSPQRKGRVVR